jgi:hypothetical protein
VPVTAPVPVVAPVVAPVPVTAPVPVVAPVLAPVPVVAHAPAPVPVTSRPAAPVMDPNSSNLTHSLHAQVEAPESPVPSSPAAESQDQLEKCLMQLLSQTTSTQEQLRSQQDQMANAIISNSQHLTQLAEQLNRMEETLHAKLSTGVE